MADWSHGYDVSVGYSYGFFREMGPDWLDLCTRVAGFETRRRPGPKAFRYLELGSGQGFGLCLFAAANPEAEFVGVDFQPEHIAHAESLAEAAGLTNVRFVEADFADLAVRWPEDFGTFDYVTMHGILSWISPRLREAVVDCLLHGTHPGSLVYAGYNTMPSWLGTVPFQHITRMLKDTTGKSGSAAVEESIKLFDRLRNAKALIFGILPALEIRIQTTKSQSVSYAVHEYMTESWNPLWHSQVAREFRRAKLQYVGSATLAENMLLELLPQPLRAPVEEQQNPELREDLQDVIVNQAFRRDIFCRGPRPRSGRQLDGIEDTRLYLLSPIEKGHTVKFKTIVGEIEMEYRAFAEVIEALAQGPRSVEELIALPNPTKRKTQRILLLMLHANILALGAAQPGDAATAQRLNAVIARAASTGGPYRNLAAAMLGAAATASDMELMLVDSWLESHGKADLSALGDGVAQRLARLGRQLHHEGKPVASADSKQKLKELASAFINDVLPRLRQLGALE
ncbi:MAG: methyltransferase regulatory domain-containing protein [Sphingomicrobium sp.]